MSQNAEYDAGLPVHAKGSGWLTACGQDRANVHSWTDDPERVTCSSCRKKVGSQNAPVGTVPSDGNREAGENDGDTTGRERSQGHNEHGQGDGAQREESPMSEVRAEVSPGDVLRRPDVRSGVPLGGLQLRVDDDAGLGVVLAALREAFSGEEFEENARAAAGEGEWSWFRWLAVSTVEGCVTPPAGGAS